MPQPKYTDAMRFAFKSGFDFYTSENPYNDGTPERVAYYEDQFQKICFEAWASEAERRKLLIW